jgi:hypothetical protein
MIRKRSGGVRELVVDTVRIEIRDEGKVDGGDVDGGGRDRSQGMQV